MKAKKILAGACASLMLATVAIPAVSAAETVKVTVGNAKAAAGEKFSVTVDLSDIPAAGINACDFGIKYDSSALSITSVKAGALAKEDTAALDGVSALETGLDAGFVSVIYGLGTTDTSSYMTGSGTFITLEGTVSNAAKAGKYDLEIVPVDRLANPDGSATNSDIIFGNLAEDNTTYTVYDPTITNGYVEVTGNVEETGETGETGETEETSESIDLPPVTKLGDVDCNDEVALADSIMLSKYLLSKEMYPLTPQGLANADVTKDGEVGPTDSEKLGEYNIQAITEF